MNYDLSMCALHHRAFDAGMLTVAPEYQGGIVEDRFAFPGDLAHRVLLDHQGLAIQLPADPGLRPSQERLEERMAELGE